MKIFNIVIFYLIFLSSLSATEFKGKFEQGSFILGKTEPNSNVKVDNKKIRVSIDNYREYVNFINTISFHKVDNSLSYDQVLYYFRNK